MEHRSVEWQERFCRDQKPEGHFKRVEDGTWVPSSDVCHLSNGGEYFQAIVWAAALFKDADLERITYRPKFVSEQEARLMREIAASLTRPGGAAK